MAWPFDNDVAGALGSTPTPATSGALPPVENAAPKPQAITIPNLAPGVLPDPDPVVFGALPPEQPAAPPPQNVPQKIASALYNTFVAPPDPNKPRSLGQTAYDNWYNIFAKGPSEAYQGALASVKEAATAEPGTYKMLPGLEELSRFGPGTYEPTRLADVALKTVAIPFAPLAGGARELGRQLIPGAHPERYEADPNAKPDLSNPDALASALGFLGENAAYMAPLPGIQAARAGKIAQAGRTAQLDRAAAEYAAKDQFVADALAKLAEQPKALPNAGIYGDNFVMRPGSEPPTVPARPARPAPKPAPEHVSPATALQAPTPEVPAQPRWEDLYEENNGEIGKQIGWFDRRSGTVRRLEEGPPEAAAGQGAPPPSPPREVVAQPAAPQPAEAAPPAPEPVTQAVIADQPTLAGEALNREFPKVPPKMAPEPVAEVPAAELPDTNTGAIRRSEGGPPEAATVTQQPEALAEPAGVSAPEVSARALAKTRGAKKQSAAKESVQEEPALFQRAEEQAPRSPRKFGLPQEAEPTVTSFRSDAPLKAHPDYKAAKAGDVEAADRVVSALTKPDTLAQARVRFGADAIYVPVVAEEAAGRNKLPLALAHRYARETGARVADDIAQSSRVYHTGGKPMERILARPSFDGPVEPGGKYVLVDDVSVMGSTLAELADHIQQGGGKVVGTVTLASASRSGKFSPSASHVRLVEARFGRQIADQFGIEPSALTADEARHLANFRDADALGTSVATARRERGKRLSAKALQQDEGGVEKSLRSPEGWEAAEGAPDAPGPKEQLSPNVRATLPENPTAEEQALISEVEKIAKRIVPQTKVTAARQLDVTGKSATLPSSAGRIRGASYVSGQRRLIAWSLEAGERAPGTLRHEAIHYLKRSEFIAPDEWKSLEKAAEKNGWMGKHNIPDRYSDLDRATQIEESVAEEYAAWARGKSQPLPPVKRVFAKIKNLLGQVAGHVRKVFGKDATAEDVFRRIESGEVGRREPVAKAATGDVIAAQRPSMRDPDTKGGPFSDLATNPPQSMREELLDDTRSLVSRLKSAASKQAINESIDRTRTALQDRFLPLLRTQKAVESQLGRKLAEEENPYLKEELSTGRKGAKLEDLTENMVRPLFTAMHEHGVTTEELEAYLYARHAPERNAQIQKINPKFGFKRGDLLEGETRGEGGSGMTNAEAADIMSAVEQSGKKPALEALARRVDDIIALGLKERVDSGLMSKEDAARWKSTYKSYVPLRGFAELEGMGLGDEARPRTGGSFNIRGAESQRAFGRETKAADILAHAIMSAEEAIVRGESNRVAQAFYNLASEKPHPDFWKIDKVETKPVWMESSQSVEYRPTKQLSAIDKDYTISLKIDGEEHRVTLNRHNPYARRLAESMKNLNGDQVTLLANTFGRVNRFLSHVNTTLNPEFVISNAFRDVQEAVVNLQQYDLKGITKGTIKDWPKALKAATQGAFHKGDGEWARWYKEFREDGARTYFNQVDDLKAQRVKLERESKLARPGLHPVEMPGTTARKITRSVFSYIEGVNLGVENAIRLSAYKNARQAGLSRAEAASLAKNLTINFNRRGTYGPLLNSMYLFFNASVQGTAIMMGALKSPRVRKIVGAAVGTGAMLEMLNSMTSGKDKDGELFYDKIDDYTKSHNLVIMDPTSDSGRFIKLPLPYGYGSFFAIGRSAAELYRGKPVNHVVSTLFGAITDAFNPIGGSGDSLLKVISPTVTDPIVELSQNRDFMNRPIVPEQDERGPQKPQSQMYWGSVSPVWKHVAATLNAGTGGDEVKPGAIDVSPEVLDYMFGQATGAAGSFYQRNADLVAKMFDPTSDISWGDIPMARRLVGGKPTWYDKQMFFERDKQIEQELAYVKDYARRGDVTKAKGEVADYRDLLSLSGIANQTRQSLSAIRQARSTLIFQHDMNRIPDDTFKLRIRRLKEAEQAALTVFNRAYVRTAKPAYVPQNEPEKPKPTPTTKKPDRRAELTDAFKRRDFASLSGTWTTDQAAQAAQSSGMPATSRILRGTAATDTLLSKAA